MSEDQYQRAIEQGAKLIEVFSVSQFEEVVGRGDFLVISDEQGEGMFILRNHGAGFILDPNRLDSLLSNHNLTRIVGLEWCAKNEPDHVESYYMDKCWTLCPDGPPQGFFDPNFTRIHPFVIKESDGTVDKNVVYCSYFSPIFSKFIFVRMYGYRAGTESTQSQARVLSSDYCSGPYFQLLPPQEAQQA